MSYYINIHNKNDNNIYLLYTIFYIITLYQQVNIISYKNKYICVYDMYNMNYIYTTYMFCIVKWI